MTSTEYNFVCECGNQAPSMSDAEYAEYVKTYGHDLHVPCVNCSIEALEDFGWTPADFVEHAPYLAKIKQRLTANALIRLKRTYRKLLKNIARTRAESRRAERQIRLNEGNPFFKHKSDLLAQSIDENKHMLDEYMSTRHKTIGVIFSLIKFFDEYGAATAHEYAAILSTSHVHVERAIETEGAKGLMELIVHHIENGANVGDFISDDCVLHEAVTEIIIAEIMHNKELRKAALDKVMEMSVEATGHPLPMYQFTALPNGEQVMKRVPPNLSVVNQSKPIEARNSA